MFYETKIVVRRIKELLGSDTETSMAKFLGIPQVTLNYCLAGKRKPSLELIYHICDKYKVSADWLLGLSEDRGGVHSAAPTPKVTKSRQKVCEPEFDYLTKIAALERRLQALESATCILLSDRTSSRRINVFTPTFISSARFLFAIR